MFIPLLAKPKVEVARTIHRKRKTLLLQDFSYSMVPKAWTRINTLTVDDHCCMTKIAERNEINLIDRDKDRIQKWLPHIYGF